mgnify:CR=1 FL=1
MSTSITTTIKPFETCGYLRYTSWEDFFVWAEDFKDGIFPVPESKLHIALANTPSELKNFLHNDYISLGMFTEGHF